MLERHEAPVVSFHTYVNAGSVDDPKGRTGLAHMFEHMAFKGTETIGSTNWPAEKLALANIERVYDQLDAERNKLAKADPVKIKTLQEQLQAAIEKADSYVESNLYPRIIEENGGVGMNALNEPVPALPRCWTDQAALQLAAEVKKSYGTTQFSAEQTRFCAGYRRNKSAGPAPARR